MLVPALCLRLRRATRELAGLERELAHAGARTLADEALARRHEELSQALRRAGYCLGVLGAGARADLLRGRRERRGLRWMAEETAAALARELEPGSESLPELTLAGARGWNLALLAGWCLCQAARHADGALRWRVAGDELRVAFDGPRPPAEFRRHCRQLSSASGIGPKLRAGALGLALS